MRAYPRSRGATASPCCTRVSSRGLSPLARGNRDPSHIRHRVLGPIPARAGQPGRWLRGAACRWAYPRSRGATLIPRGKVYFDPGLSPLARGNPLRASRAGSPSGPIPARAGQPGRQRPVGTLGGAYPRSRGATVVFTSSDQAVSGLSPLARGNLTSTAVPSLGAGPIPARAGQPPYSHRFFPYVPGLSPLARGNHNQPWRMTSLDGPIPARAGQPLARCVLVTQARAYPRSRGATRCDPSG